MANKLDWDPECVEYVRRNYGKLSAQQIAVTMPGTRRFSRNAVVGKAMRLGLTSDLIGGKWGSKVRSRGEPQPAPKPRVARKTIARARPDGAGVTYQQITLIEPVIDLPDLVCEPVSVSERADYQCSWPLDGGLCCGLPKLKPYVSNGRRVAPSYCASHYHASISPNKYSGTWRSPT